MKFNRVTNDSTLYKNDCSLHTLPGSAISRVCPDCPLCGNPSEESFQAAARESLAKFNAENNHYHYFAVREVTKASSQWVVGESNFVEYIIQETSCRKSSPVSDISKCPLLPDETADAGLCKGSVINSRLQFEKIVTVQCELFPHLPPANVTETPPKQKEEEVQVANCRPGSLDSSPTIASIKEEAPTTISPYRKAISLSTDCPGEVAVNILGLNLPSRQQSETKKA
ncbi:PREDICTED: fetuin-B-like [Thamnophis sirtalis]|uniref:Fetuin-B-like n=1 Tax=Thamnophis sirtalis TaxID=35019 RepID=A0A6I9YQR6_9SAUR|nr:PREDICTED: fetuin-B-like [Thamnophis sirtalis]